MVIVKPFRAKGRTDNLEHVDTSDIDAFNDANGLKHLSATTVNEHIFNTHGDTGHHAFWHWATGH